MKHGVLFALLLLFPATVSAQNADRRTGVTLFQQGTAVGASYINVSKSDLFDGSNRESDPLDRKVEKNLVVMNVSYGLTADLTLGLSIPYVEQDLRTNTMVGDRKFGDSGLGDLSVLAKYRFLKIDAPRRTLQVAALVGMEFPTGQTSENDSAGLRLAAQQQLGSGSYDALLGIAATQVLGRFGLSASTFYKLNLEGSQDFKAGDLLTVEIGSQYRFYQARFPGPEAGVRLGTSWEYAGRAKQSGSRVRNSGGHEIFANAGMFFAPRADLVFSAGVQYPVYHDLHGSQLGTDFVLFTGFEFRF